MWIELHKPDGQAIHILAEDIRSIEVQGPATLVRVGEKGIYVVTESPDEIKSLLGGGAPPGEEQG